MAANASAQAARVKSPPTLPEESSDSEDEDFDPMFESDSSSSQPIASNGHRWGVSRQKKDQAHVRHQSVKGVAQSRGRRNLQERLFEKESDGHAVSASRSSTSHTNGGRNSIRKVNPTARAGSLANASAAPKAKPDKRDVGDDSDSDEDDEHDHLFQSSSSASTSSPSASSKMKMAPARTLFPVVWKLIACVEAVWLYVKSIAWGRRCVIVFEVGCT